MLSNLTVNGGEGVDAEGEVEVEPEPDAEAISLKKGSCDKKSMMNKGYRYDIDYWNKEVRALVS